MKRYFLNGKTNESESHSLTDLQILGLQESDFVWFEGLDAWEPVGDIEELESYIKRKVVPPSFQSNLIPPPFTNEQSEESNSTAPSMPYGLEVEDRPGGCIYIILVWFFSIIFLFETEYLNIFTLIFFRLFGFITILYVSFIPFRVLFRKEYPDVIKNEKSLIPSEFAKLIDYLKEGGKFAIIFLVLYVSSFHRFIHSCDLWVREITGWNHPLPGKLLGIILSFIPLFLIVGLFILIANYIDKSKK